MDYTKNIFRSTRQSLVKYTGYNACQDQNKMEIVNNVLNDYNKFIENINKQTKKHEITLTENRIMNALFLLILNAQAKENGFTQVQIEEARFLLPNTNLLSAVKPPEDSIVINVILSIETYQKINSDTRLLNVIKTLDPQMNKISDLLEKEFGERIMIICKNIGLSTPFGYLNLSPEAENLLNNIVKIRNKNQ